jgi:hypothetical protein
MAADPGWAQATNGRAGIPYERDVIAELDAENARLHGELIDVQCELATARHAGTRRCEPPPARRDGSARLGGLAAAGS